MEKFLLIFQRDKISNVTPDKTFLITKPFLVLLFSLIINFHPFFFFTRNFKVILFHTISLTMIIFNIQW
jgi:hypothetical protein